MFEPPHTASLTLKRFSPASLTGDEVTHIEWVYRVTPDVAAEFRTSVIEGGEGVIEAAQNILNKKIGDGAAYLLFRAEKDAEDRPHGEYEEWNKYKWPRRKGHYNHGKTEGIWRDISVEGGPFLWCEDGRNPDGLRADNQEDLEEKVRLWKNPPPSLDP